MSPISLPDTLERAILVCGANWSGSTMVGAVLGAAEDGPFTQFHVGEIHAYNNPRKARTYGNPRRASQLTNFWADVAPRETGEGLFADVSARSGCQSYIDSSKLPAWFKPIVATCAENDVPVRIVISFRSIAAIAASGIKRGHNIDTTVTQCQRYQHINTMMKQMGRDQADAVVNTENFTKDPARHTKRLCELVGVPYFPGKENYWNYPGAHLFGSATQSRHFLSPETGGYASRTPVSRDSLSPELREKLDNAGMFALEDDLLAGRTGPLVG